MTKRQKSDTRRVSGVAAGVSCWPLRTSAAVKPCLSVRGRWCKQAHFCPRIFDPRARASAPLPSSSLGASALIASLYSCSLNSQRADEISPPPPAGVLTLRKKKGLRGFRVVKAKQANLQLEAADPSRPGNSCSEWTGCEIAPSHFLSLLAQLLLKICKNHTRSVFPKR